MVRKFGRKSPTSPDEAGPYQSFAALIEPYADGPFDDLPDGLRERVNECFPVHWDQLEPDQRRSLALQIDLQDDPSMKPEHDYWWGLEGAIWGAELEIAEWNKKDTRIPSEALIWQGKSDGLRERLRRLEMLRGFPPFTVEGWDRLTDDALAKAVQNATAPAQNTAKTAPKVAASNAPEIPKNKRPNLLTPLIEKAQCDEVDPFNAAVIWPKLCNMAEVRIKPLQGKTEEGIQWMDGNDEVQFLSLKKLRDRLSRQAKAAIELAKPR